MNENLLIEVKDCVKIYKRNEIKTVAIRKLKCNFYSGEITVLMGPSGAGKSTFLNILGGVERCDSGEIQYKGEDITTFNDDQMRVYRANIGFLFQLYNLFPELTAEENIELPMVLAKLSSLNRKSRIQELLTRVELTTRAKHYPGEMSGGEQQRVGLAVALANQPSLLLCDEPTGELDTISKLKIMNILKQQITDNPAMAIIIVSHDPDFKKIADRLYYIKDGEIISERNREQLEQEVSNFGGKSYSADPNFSKNIDSLVEKGKILEQLLEIEKLVKEKIVDLQK